jgi:pyruvate dehydrogenase E1 component alpha subunit
MRAFLRGRGASDEFFAEVDAEGAAVAEDARARTVALESIASDVMFDHVYSEAHPVIAEQKQWLADYEASFEEGRA